MKLMNENKETNYNYAKYPTPKTQGNNAAQIHRGEYLVKAGDCIACHTNSPKKGTPFAGGLPMYTPFGTIYSPNITADKETGIGNWTDAQFIKAMREGISPEGHYYYPAFPYYYFNKISDDDLLAIKAYLENIPTVKQTNPANNMMFPFNFRFLQWGWRVLFFYHNNTGAYENNAAKSAEWNRGAYLVDSLGHCAMCHSPSYHIISDAISLGAPIKKYDLTGAKIQGYSAPNITKSNIGNVPNAEIVSVFLEDKMIGGGKVEGPMLEANHDSLRYLSHDDLNAIASYLKTVESQTPATSGGPGAATYEGYCAGCHANGSNGAPKPGDKTAWEALEKKSGGLTNLYQNAIHGIGAMPAKGTCLACSETDIKQAVDYMIQGEEGSTQEQPPNHEAPLTPADGKRIYEKECASCHTNGSQHAPKTGDLTAWKHIEDVGFYDALKNVVTGQKGHPSACTQCSDAELKAAVKYIMQQGTTTKNYNLW